MAESALIKKSKSLIQAVKEKNLSIEERKEQAIALAALIMEEAQRIQTPQERRQQAQLAGMMRDPIGKVFTTALTDQCFRSRRPQRIADQLVHLIKTVGIPHYLPFSMRLALHTLARVGNTLASLAIPLTIRLIRNEVRHVILPAEAGALARHMKRRRQEGVRLNLNRLGEAILGEEEAEHRLRLYLQDLAHPDVEYVSVKISTLCSQIHLPAWQETLSVLADRLRQLYRAAIKHRYVRSDGTSSPKFVNLDMEEYRDLSITVALFRQVLDEEEFSHYSAGIVLQSYLPDSFPIQQELTQWAKRRLAQGRAPIKIRLVKGANLAMEQFESALHLWPQAPYCSKAEVDANYKRMMVYGCQKGHAAAAQLGIGSHNVFDIAYALLLRAENNVEHEVGFEMLEGMADPLRRVIHQLAGHMLLYCPIAEQKEFQHAIAYLVRRLDENTAPENFLRHAFELKPGTPEWNRQIHLFSDACLASPKASYFSNRTQNRQTEKPIPRHDRHFNNEPDTDWSLLPNRQWAENILHEWKDKVHLPIPLAIAGELLPAEGREGIGKDPSYPDKILYRYALASETQIDRAIEAAKSSEAQWSQTPFGERVLLLRHAANVLRLHRGDLIGAMVADTGKTVVEADSEVSEAIDFAEYYALNLQEWHQLPDIQWNAKGILLVAPPWNFPCSIPAGGILAALATGNCVLFKPAPESVLVGWYLAGLFWQAGISREVLQFIPCEDHPAGSRLVQDPRVSAIVLTGATATAKLFLRMRPGLDLMAETGGKNAMVITALADRDLAIKDLLHSSFGHAGQKCSACSLAILEAEVYDDPHFLQQLRDAAQSLAVGSPWNLNTRINPLIRPPEAHLMKGLTELEAGEEWLLKPVQNADNPHLWSPGIKLGVTPASFTFQHELFGPLLALVRAESVEHAFELMNQTPYGLTAGLHSLDEREQRTWLNRIEAGNAYINRTMTGAVVERQPFGGCKESSFGKGSKAGGPDYLVQFMHAEQTSFPAGQAPLNDAVTALSTTLEQDAMFFSDLPLWKASVGSYAFFWDQYFSKSHDPSLVRGQDNLHRYLPHPHVLLRGQKGDAPLDLLRVVAAALTCGTSLELSLEEEDRADQFQALAISRFLRITQESNDAFTFRVAERKIGRIRLLQPPPETVQTALARAACHLHIAPVLANGRLELLHLLREVSISCDYHRYGNLGEREKERRHPLPDSVEKRKIHDSYETRCQHG